MKTADFIHPTGELLPAFFPNETLAELVYAWMQEAEAKTAALPASCAEQAAAAWVYHRAFLAVANRIAATPTREAYFNDVDRWHSADRVEYFRDKAAGYLQQFQALASAGSRGDGTSVVQRPPMTGGAGLRAAW